MQGVEIEMQDKFNAIILKNQKEKQLETQYSRAPIMDFLQTKPLSFSIAVEPMEAEKWLMDTSRKLKSVWCKEEQKVHYADYFLTGLAATWWEELNYKWSEGGVIAWTDFKQKFREAFVVGSITMRKGGEA
jgi:hypothetical protein